MRRIKTKRFLGTFFAVALVTAPAWAGAPWSLDWWTMDGGGEVFTSGGSWELSGTVGQWDASASGAASGGTWELTGGFWSVSAGASDRVFSDGFEG